MKRVWVILATVCLLSADHLMASSFDLQFVPITNNGVNYDVKIQIKANGSSFNIGTSSLIFTYNSAALSNPALLAAHGYSGGNYLPLVINATRPPRVAINIELGVPPGTPVPLTYTDVATIRFTTTNASDSSSLRWVTTGGAATVVFLDDETTIVPAGTLNNLNTTPLPVQLESSAPREFALYQNHPNPFNPSTTLRYVIPKAGEVTLKIYDLVGNEIATLVSEKQPAGEYTVRWNPVGLPSGVYFYRLQVEGSAQKFVATKKLILLQ